MQEKLQNAKNKVTTFVKKHPVLCITIPTAIVVTIPTLDMLWRSGHDNVKQDKNNIPDDVCVLVKATNETAYEVCRYGIEQGMHIAEKLIDDICHADMHFDYTELYKSCEKYYNDPDWTRDCLDGLFVGLTIIKEKYKILCALQQRGLKVAFEYTGIAYTYPVVFGTLFSSIQYGLNNTDTGKSVKNKCFSMASWLSSGAAKLWHKVHAPDYEHIADENDDDFGDDLDIFVGDGSSSIEKESSSTTYQASSSTIHQLS